MRRSLLLVITATALVLQALPSAAAPAHSRSQLLLDVLAANTEEARAPTFAESDSWDDPTGDPTDIETQATVDEPRVDITDHDLDYTSEALTLSVAVTQPTNPNTDAAWEQSTMVGWFLDTDDDGGGDFFVDYSLTIEGPQEIEVLVRTVLPGGTQGPDQCGGMATGTFEGGRYVAVIPPDCIDTPDAVAPNPGMLFQEGPNEPTTNDFAPNGGGFENAVAITQLEEDVTDRLAGGDRIATSVAISEYQFPDGADVAYLARADVFADAVSGGSLTDGPILLVPTCGPVPQIVLDELVRLGVGEVISLGGTAAVCDQVLEDAAAAAEATSGRLAGPERFSTSVAISQDVFPVTADNVFLARADVFADAVAAGVLTSGPILLVPQCGDIPQVVLDEIGRLSPRGVYALGGTAAVCDETLQQAADASVLVITVDRLAGPTRIDTAIAISQFQFADGDADVAFLAREDILADAVSAGSLTGGPVLLVPTCGTLPAAVGEEIARVGADLVIALGGTAAICDDILAQAGEAVVQE
ncbi:MAG TPA: cell wall-binding repeat-containing protein [Euzebya sp.]|nr:cell wall-binding repeat-containing protein [Euzebya sp.]